MNEMQQGFLYYKTFSIKCILVEKLHGQQDSNNIR